VLQSLLDCNIGGTDHLAPAIDLCVQNAASGLRRAICLRIGLDVGVGPVVQDLWIINPPSESSLRDLMTDPAFLREQTSPASLLPEPTSASPSCPLQPFAHGLQ
jgi:hypothetical protein